MADSDEIKEIEKQVVVKEVQIKEIGLRLNALFSMTELKSSQAQ